MEIEIRELKDDRLKFFLSGATPEFVNSLRRAILQEIPVMAVDEVDFMANDSVVDDEILAHRLGQVPLHTPEGYLLPSECDCRDGRCSNCSVSLTLKAEGPSLVKSGTLESSDTEVVPASDSFPLTRLGEGQKLELMAIARLGFGKDHPNWQPALASYKYMPIFGWKKDECTLCGDCVEACPPDLLEIADDEVVINDLEECTMCKACVDACPEGAIDIDQDSSKFIFKVESFGCMSPVRILEKAAEVLKEKCEDFIGGTERF